MCKQADETVSHLVSECQRMAQKEYKAKHDRVATAVHWCLCKKYGLSASDQWYQHRAERVMENEDAKLLWDYNIFTDHNIETRRPGVSL